MFKFGEHKNNENLIGCKKWIFVDVSAGHGDGNTFNNDENHLHVLST